MVEIHPVCQLTPSYPIWKLRLINIAMPQSPTYSRTIARVQNTMSSSLLHFWRKPFRIKQNSLRPISTPGPFLGMPSSCQILRKRNISNYAPPYLKHSMTRYGKANLRRRSSLLPSKSSPTAFPTSFLLIHQSSIKPHGNESPISNSQTELKKPNASYTPSSMNTFAASSYRRFSGHNSPNPISFLLQI